MEDLRLFVTTDASATVCAAMILVNIPHSRNTFKNPRRWGNGGWFGAFYWPEAESGSKVGGASAIAAPQLVLGESPMTNFNLAPFLNSSTVSHNFELGLPLTIMLWTYLASREAWLASMVMIFPSGRCNTALGNNGLSTVTPPTPGISGYIPSAVKIYQADIAPLSSSPGMP